MADEIITPNPEQENQQEESMVDIITELRANTVPKDRYQKLEEDNRKLMKALANGETIQVEAPNTPDIEELRKNYLDFENKTDLQIAKDTLALRNALIEAGEADPFLPNGKTVEITDQDIVDAQRVADLLQYAIDQSNGDSGVFSASLASKLVDTSLPGATNKRRR